MFGVFEHTVDYKRSILFRGFDDRFMVPHSRGAIDFQNFAAEQLGGLQVVHAAKLGQHHGLVDAGGLHCIGRAVQIKCRRRVSSSKRSTRPASSTASCASSLRASSMARCFSSLASVLAWATIRRASSFASSTRRWPQNALDSKYEAELPTLE